MRILVAEDERISRRALSRTLESWGHAVTAVENGALAWAAVQEQSFDVVVTDWDMPEMTGPELVRRIRTSPSAEYVYVIVLTARTEKHDLVEGMESGADDFLAKPFDRDELRVRLAAGERIISLERCLAENNSALQSANERMHHDLAAAARVQHELLPAENPAVQGVRFAWHFQPCDELGGDLLNVLPIGEAHAVMYLADVSGHGVASSLTSVSVHRTLSVQDDQSSLILSRDAATGVQTPTDAAEVTRRLNALYPMSSNGGHFLTLVYATLDAAERRLSYCAAGHLGPAVVRAGEPVRFCDSGGVPIGVLPDSEYQGSSLDLVEGDRIYFFSDGLIEAMDPKKELFGLERISEILEDCRGTSLDDSISCLVESAIQWQQTELFSDDLSVLAFEVAES